MVLRDRVNRTEYDPLGKPNRPLEFIPRIDSLKQPAQKRDDIHLTHCQIHREKKRKLREARRKGGPKPAAWGVFK